MHKSKVHQKGRKKKEKKTPAPSIKMGFLESQKSMIKAKKKLDGGTGFDKTCAAGFGSHTFVAKPQVAL